MSAFTDLNGLWSGTYGYAAEAEPVAFTAWVDDQSGALGGTILEPNTMAFGGGEELSAIIAGTRAGHDAHFTKTYDPGQATHDQAIVYTGAVSSDFTLITGRWHMPGEGDWSGPFEMRRRTGALEKAQREMAAENVF